MCFIVEAVSIIHNVPSYRLRLLDRKDIGTFYLSMLSLFPVRFSVFLHCFTMTIMTCIYFLEFHCILAALVYEYSH